MNEELSIVFMRNSTDAELLRYIDRSDPVVKELATRLEQYVDFDDQYTMPQNIKDQAG